MHPSQQHALARKPLSVEVFPLPKAYWATAETAHASALLVAAYLCACFLAFSDWMRVRVVVAGGAFVLTRTGVRAMWQPATSDVFRKLALHFIAWMTARSLVKYNLFNPPYGREAAWWLFGTFVLVLFGGMM